MEEVHGNAVTVNNDERTFKYFDSQMPFRLLKEKLLSQRPTNGGLTVTKYRIRGRIVQQRVKFPNGEEHWINYKLVSEVLKEVQ